MDQTPVTASPAPRPLFRPEAMAQPAFGEAFAFAVPRWRGVGLLAAALAALLALYGLFADFDRVAEVRGVVTPASGVSRVVAPQGGVVTAVLVREGAMVARGAPLLRIAAQGVLPSGEAARTRILATFGDQRRAAAAGAEADRAQRAAESRRLAEEEAGYAAAAASLGDQIALQRERIASNERRLANLDTLRGRGYVSEVTYQAQAEAVLSLRQQLAGLRQNEAEAGHNRRQSALRIAELAAGGRRAEEEAAIARAELERGTAGAQVAAEVTLAAPAAGRVAAMRASPGLVVAGSDELAAIVDPADRLEVRLFVPPALAGSLRVGQEVVLRYDAFPWQRHGVGRGIVTAIAGATASEARGTPTYRVAVRLRDGARLALRPDMTLSAGIVLERRSLLDWLLAPLRERWRQARARAGGAA